MNIRELSKDQLLEESLIDLAYAILEEKKSPIPFLELMREIQTLLGLSEEEIKERLVQFYTDLNIDGRFLLNNDNTWGLREWYKIETIEEETAPTIKTRKRKAKAILTEDDEEIEIDEDDLIFEEDFEEFVDDETEDDEELDDEEIDFVEELDDLDVDEDMDSVDGELIEDDEAFIIEDDEENVEDEESEE